MKITRRRFLAGMAAAGAAIGVDVFGFEAHRVLVSRHNVRVPGLPTPLDGLRIALITDVHLPGNRLAARSALEHLHRERPQIVLLIGDMTESVEASNQVRDFAANARGTIATVATLGNWEYAIGLVGDVARGCYRGTGVDLLVNDSKIVDVGAPLALVGLDDLIMGRPDLMEARKRLVPGCTEIWLIHEPAFADTPPPGAARPAMLLTGHTHGGQIRIPLVPPVKPHGSGRFLEGWYHDTFAPLYVTRGVGTTGIPARFLCPPELPIFTLRAA